MGALLDVAVLRQPSHVALRQPQSQTVASNAQLHRGSSIANPGPSTRRRFAVGERDALTRTWQTERAVQSSRAAVILAGGRSSRMGRPKEWLEIDGVPLLRRVVDAAISACPLVVVVARAGQDLPTLPAAVVRLDDPPEHEGEGPLAAALVGLVAAAERGCEVAFLGASDAPFVDARHIEFVLERLERDRTAMAVVPESGPFDDGTRVLHALAGGVRVGVARATAFALVQSDKRALKMLYEGLAARRLAVASLPDPEAVRGCNTPDEWAQVLSSRARPA
ncbi:MAG TPA: NTP transferase domain-containing protein [Nannocystaceae bacterium]|nr:NTP transferase domain-containing protein [Nannocystaceae bacterium]